MTNNIYSFSKVEKKMRSIFSTKNCLNPNDKVNDCLHLHVHTNYFCCFLSDVEILYDSSIRFNERLYIRLGVDLTHIKLRRTLRDIISQPLVFVRDALSKETFDALDKLHQVNWNFNLCSINFSPFVACSCA